MLRISIDCDIENNTRAMSLPEINVNSLIDAMVQIAYSKTRAAGLMPLVSRVSLSKIMEIPPKHFP